MEHDPLTNISALDGRYRNKIGALAELASEFGLMRFRVTIECEWFIHLANCPDIPELPPLDDATEAYLRRIADDFDLAAARRIKALEATTNHDVKAVEYFVKEQLATDGELAPLTPWDSPKATRTR